MPPSPRSAPARRSMRPPTLGTFPVSSLLLVVEQRYVQLRVQAAHSESNGLARERSKVQINAEHLLWSIRRFESERQRHAQLGSDDRQVGPGAVPLARARARAAEIRLRLPVRALAGLHDLEAPVLGMDFALGLDVRADLQA